MFRAVALLVACWLFFGWFQGCRQTVQPLRIGFNTWPGYEFLYLAQEKGLLRDAKVEVRLVEFTSLADCRRAYERGQLDGFLTTTVEVIQVLNNSERRPEIIRVIDYSDGADVVLARPGIQSLKGTRVGLEMASAGSYLLARALQRLGLTLEDVRLISTDPQSMEALFREGKIDAMVTYPPFASRVLGNGEARQVFSSAEIPGEVVDVFAVEGAVLKTRRVEFEQVLAAFDLAKVYTKQNPANAYQIMANREGITAEEFENAINNGMVNVHATEQAAYLGVKGTLKPMLELTEKVMRETKQISGHRDVHSLVNGTFVSPSQKSFAR